MIAKIFCVNLQTVYNSSRSLRHFEQKVKRHLWRLNEELSNLIVALRMIMVAHNSRYFARHSPCFLNTRTIYKVSWGTVTTIQVIEPCLSLNLSSSWRILVKLGVFGISHLTEMEKAIRKKFLKIFLRHLIRSSSRNPRNGSGSHESESRRWWIIQPLQFPNPFRNSSLSLTHPLL